MSVLFNHSRYPVVASEILMCDDEKISKALLSSETLARFFNFFANPKPDLLLSAVVIKVLISLLELHTAEVCFILYISLLPLSIPSCSATYD